MFFLNLSAAEFFTLLGVLGGFTAALYLLDRAKRNRVVSTLRFWIPGAAAEERQRRTSVREPWSLVLQLMSLTLLLAAIANLNIGSPARAGRDHVLLLDTSAWAGEHSGGTALIDREKQMAERYVAALPGRDRVMVVRVDALATPVTAFTADRKQITRAVNESQAGFSALAIEQALRFAEEARNWGRGERGEIVYIGPGMKGESAAAVMDVAQLRTLLMRPDREHVGIRSVGVRRSENDEHAWQAAVLVENYGRKRALVRLEVECAGSRFAPRGMTLEAGEQKTAEYEFVTQTGGELGARIEPPDVLSGDQNVRLALPQPAKLRVAVITDRPEALQPLFAANDQLSVHFFRSWERESENWADLAVFDRVAPTFATRKASIWIDPPREQSPLPVKAELENTSIANWNVDTPLSGGLHAKDRRIPAAEVFQTFEGDIAVASATEGPLVVARNANGTHGKLAVIGFDPLAGGLRYDVTTPILFANLLRWISPDVFRPAEASAERVGAVTVRLEGNEPAEAVRVVDARGTATPFFMPKQSGPNMEVQIFAQRPEVLRVISEARERVLSIVLPDVARFEWKPPANAARGLPAVMRVSPGSVDVWKWLATVAALGLFIEWTLFGRRRATARRMTTADSAIAVERERELAAR